MTIALIAHNGKKADMVAFMLKYKDLLLRNDVQIISTATTGSHVAKAGLKVRTVLSGPLGGDAQIAADVANGLVDWVFFFRDPLDSHPHEPDISMLMRLCDVHNIPLATNPATAELIMEGKISGGK